MSVPGACPVSGSIKRSELVKYSPLSGSRTPSLQLSLSKTVFGDRAFVSCSHVLVNSGTIYHHISKLQVH